MLWSYKAFIEFINLPPLLSLWLSVFHQHRLWCCKACRGAPEPHVILTGGRGGGGGGGGGVLKEFAGPLTSHHSRSRPSRGGAALYRDPHFGRFGYSLAVKQSCHLGGVAFWFESEVHPLWLFAMGAESSVQRDGKSQEEDASASASASASAGEISAEVNTALQEGSSVLDSKVLRLLDPSHCLPEPPKPEGAILYVIYVHVLCFQGSAKVLSYFL